MTIEELAGRVGLPVRTVRFYMAQGLLPGAGARGKAATYSEEHLLRLRLIRLLSERRVPLSEQREQLTRLPLEAVRAVLADAARGDEERRRASDEGSPRGYVSALLERAREARLLAPMPPSPAPACPAPREPRAELAETSPLSYGAMPPSQSEVTWRRWELAPGVELHVRADAEDRQRDLIARLRRAAREVL